MGTPTCIEREYQGPTIREVFEQYSPEHEARILWLTRHGYVYTSHGPVFRRCGCFNLRLVEIYIHCETEDQRQRLPLIPVTGFGVEVSQ